MAFGRIERNGGTRPMSDINMTPLIDVMLVLMVIFMITAPLISTRLKLELPHAESAAAGDAPAAVTLAVDADGALYFGDDAVDADALRRKLHAASQSNPRLEVQLRADRRVPYGRVAELIGLVQAAGLSRIGFITDPSGP